MPLKNIPQAPNAPMKYAPNPPMVYAPKPPTPPPHNYGGANVFQTPRVFTDPWLNLRVRNYYANRDRNVWSEAVGRIYGAGIGATHGAVMGNILGTIIGTIIALAGAATPIPGDETAGALLATKSISGLAKAAKTIAVTTINQKGWTAGLGQIGKAVGGTIGGTVGLATSNYTTYYAMKDLIKNTIGKTFSKDAGVGVLNSLYAVGKSMDIMTGGELGRALIYSIVSGENALESIAKAYGLHYTGRRDTDTALIREELGVDLGTVGNMTIDIVGDLITDPGMNAVIGKGIAKKAVNKRALPMLIEVAEKEGTQPIQRLLAEAGMAKAEVIEQTVEATSSKATKEAAETATKSVGKEARKAARHSRRLQRRIRNAILDRDYETIILELAKRGEVTDVTYSAVKKFVDTVNQAISTTTSYKMYTFFKEIDKIDDLATANLFSLFSPPVATIRLAKKGIKFAKTQSYKYVDKTGKELSSSDKAKYFFFGNKATYKYEYLQQQDIEKAYSKEINKYFDKTYNVGKKDISDEITQYNGEKYTINNFMRDTDQLDELIEKETITSLSKEEQATKNLLEKRLSKMKEHIEFKKSKLGAQLEELKKSLDNAPKEKIIGLQEQIADLQKLYNKFEISSNISKAHIKAFRKHTNRLRHIIGTAKSVNKNVDELGYRAAFDNEVNRLIKLVTSNADLQDELKAKYFTNFIDFIEDNVSEVIQKTVKDLFEPTKEKFEAAQSELDALYKGYQEQAEKVIDKLENFNTSYSEYKAVTEETGGSAINETEYKAQLMKELEQINAKVNELNEQSEAQFRKTNLSITSFLNSHFIKKREIKISKKGKAYKGKAESYNRNFYQKFIASNGAQEYMQLVDAMNSVEKLLNELDLDESKRKGFVQALLNKYTQELYGMDMDKEVAAIYKTDENLNKVFGQDFDHDFTLDPDTRLSSEKRQGSLNRFIEEIDNKIKGHTAKGDSIEIINRLKSLRRSLNNSSEAYWEDLFKIADSNKNSSGIIDTIITSGLYKTSEIKKYIKELSNSKTNPTTIVYLDRYIRTFKRHIERLQKLEVESGFTPASLAFLEGHVNEMEKIREIFFKQGFDSELFTNFKNSLRTTNNCLSTENVIRNMEKFSKNDIDLEIQDLEKLKQKHIEELNTVRATYESKIAKRDELLAKRKEIEEVIPNFSENDKQLYQEIVNARKENNKLFQKKRNETASTNIKLQDTKTKLAKKVDSRSKYLAFLDKPKRMQQQINVIDADIKQLESDIELKQNKLPDTLNECHDISVKIHKNNAKIKQLQTIVSKYEEALKAGKKINQDSYSKATEKLANLKKTVQKQYNELKAKGNKYKELQSSIAKHKQQIANKLDLRKVYKNYMQNPTEIESTHKRIDVLNKEIEELQESISFQEFESKAMQKGTVWEAGENWITNQETDKFMQEYTDMLTKQKMLREIDDGLDDLQITEFVDNKTPIIDSLTNQIQDLVEKQKSIKGHVFNMKQALNRVTEANSDLFAQNDITDYAFRYAVNEFRTVLSEATDSIRVNGENGKFMFGKSLFSRAISVFKQMSSFDESARLLVRFLEPKLRYIQFKANPKELLNLFRDMSEMVSHVDTLRSSRKVMDDLGLTSKISIDGDKLVVKLDSSLNKDGVDITDFFRKSKGSESNVTIDPATGKRKVEKTRLGKGYDYSFNKNKFKRYAKFTKLPLDKNIDELIPVDTTNMNKLLKTEDIFTEVIKGESIIWTPNNSIMFNIKQKDKALRVKPKKKIYMDVETTNAGEANQQALILQLHMYKLMENGDVIEQSIFLDPDEFSNLIDIKNPNKSRFTWSEEAFKTHNIDLDRLKLEKANENTRTLNEMRLAFEKFGCLDDDSVIIAHNGNGFDFGVLINNFYNDEAAEVFDSTGKFNKQMVSKLNANCMDSMQMNLSLFNRGSRLSNVEIAKQMGIKVKEIHEAPNATNVSPTDDIVEYIYKNDKGKQVVEQYFQGLPLHDAKADTRLTAAWHKQQMQQLDELIPEDIDYYDFVSDPVYTVKTLKDKTIQYDNVGDLVRRDINGNVIQHIGKEEYINKINRLLKFMLPNSEGIKNLDNITYREIIDLSTQLEYEFNVREMIGDLSSRHYYIDNDGSIDKFASIRREFKDKFGDIEDYSEDEVFELSKGMFSLSDDYDAFEHAVYDTQDDIGVSEIDSHWSSLNEESEEYLSIREDLDLLKQFADGVYEDLRQKITNVAHFVSQNHNTAVQQFNKGYVQSLLINTTLTDPDFMTFKHILDGNSSVFHRNSREYQLAEAFKMMDTESSKKARKYFDDLYESAIWQSETITDIGSQNIDAFYRMLDDLKIGMYERAKDGTLKYSDVESFRSGMHKQLKDYLLSLKAYDNPTNISESQLNDIIDYACRHFREEDYSLTISSDVTNHMYRYIKGEILDKISTAVGASKALDNKEPISELYSYFNRSFRDMLESYRGTLSAISKQNKEWALEPIDLASFTQANGLRPYDLVLNNARCVLKYTDEKKASVSLSKISNDIYDGCYKPFDPSMKTAYLYGNTRRGDLTRYVSKLLGMDEKEMLSLSRNVKYLDDKAQYDLIWEQFLKDTDHPDHALFEKMEARLQEITEDTYQSLNPNKIELFKKRTRNMFLDRYMDLKELNALEEAYRTMNPEDVDLFMKANKQTKKSILDEVQQKAAKKQFTEDINIVKKGLNEVSSRVAKDENNFSLRMNAVKKNIEAVRDSNNLYMNIRQIYRNGEDAAQGMVDFFSKRKDMVLVNLDDKFQLKLMDTNDPRNIKRIIEAGVDVGEDAEAAAQRRFAVMSRDEYLKLVNETQPIVLPGWLEALHKFWVLPSKIFGLAFSVPYMIRNMTSAYLQNVTANGMKPVQALIDLVKTANDFHKWKEIYELVTAENNSIYDLLGSFDDVNAGWLDVLEAKDGNYAKLLDLEINNLEQAGKSTRSIKRLRKLLDDLTPEDIINLREMQEFATTNATFGEITDVQRNLVISKQKTEAMNNIRARLKEGKKVSDEELAEFKLYNTRPNDGFKTLSEEMDYLLAKAEKTTDDHHRLSMLKKYKKSGGYTKFMQGFQKYTGMRAWMNLNSNIESVFRISMLRRQMDEGADLAQATQKVMDTHFIYNDKSIAMRMLEVIMPFASYPIKAANLFTELAGDYSFVKAMYVWDQNSWGDNDPGFSNYLKKRKAQGDIPFVNFRGEDRLLHLGNAFTESLTALSNPLSSMGDKLAPYIKIPIDLATGAENPRWSWLTGPTSMAATGIQDMERTGSLHAGSFVNMTQAYTNYQANYHRGMYRNYPQHAYMRPFYKNLYTSGGYSRVSMAMQQTTLDNLQYRVGTILYNNRYRHK